MDRVANLPQHLRILNHTLGTQRQILDLQLQIATGKVARDYAGIADQAERVVSLESAHARAAQHTENNALVGRRLQAMETNIGQIFDAVSAFRTHLLSALNADNGTVSAVTNEAAALKQQVASLLNVQQDGRYLFAGSRIDAQPVDLSGLTPTTIPVTPPLTSIETEYYRGDQVTLSVEADQGLSVSYGLTADEPAFEHVLRAAHYVEQAGNPPDRATLETALALINTALGTAPADTSLGVGPIPLDLADLRSVIGTAQSTLESTNRRLDEFMLFSEQSIGDIENVDVTTAISKLTAQQTQLEASYAVIARLSQLNLAEYLR